jgi:hypothetical protein
MSYADLAYSKHCILAEHIPTQQWHIGYPITHWAIAAGTCQVPAANWEAPVLSQTCLS